MGLEVQKAIDHMGTGPLQPPGLSDIGGLIKAGFQLHKGRDRFAVFCGLAQRFDNRAVAGGAVEGLLDRHHIGVARGLGQKADDHIEGFVRVVQQHVLLADGCEHIPVMIAHPFGHPWGELRPEQIGAVIKHQLRQVVEAQHPVDLNHIARVHAQLFHHGGFDLFRRTGRVGEADNLAPAAALQGNLKFAHEVFGLILDLKIAVAQDAEFEMGL